LTANRVASASPNLDISSGAVIRGPTRLILTPSDVDELQRLVEAGAAQATRFRSAAGRAASVDRELVGELGMTHGWPHRHHHGELNASNSTP
jgi:hypothetical protein